MEAELQHSSTPHEMDMSGKLHVSSASSSNKIVKIFNKNEAVWILEQRWSSDRLSPYWQMKPVSPNHKLSLDWR